MSAKRCFDYDKPIVCYNNKSLIRNESLYNEKRENALSGQVIEEIIVGKKSAQAWEMQANDLCRVSLLDGSQVGDLNFWNLHNTDEHFYSGKTRQLHSSHLKVYDHLWSCLPYLNKMATFVCDSLSDYGIDRDGGSLHDVIGTRCDQYTYRLISGEDSQDSCHSYLTNAIKKFNLTEKNVHDVWNIFMLTGFTRDTNQYFCKPSPARKGDFIEFIADMDLLVALSACPQGDVSIQCGEKVPDEKCHRLGVKIFRTSKK